MNIIPFLIRSFLTLNHIQNTTMIVHLRYLCIIICLFCQYQSTAADYYVNPKLGNDDNSGESKETPFKSLARAGLIDLLPGDRILLAAGITHFGSLNLKGIKGSSEKPIYITSYSQNESNPMQHAIIDFQSLPHGILLEDCSSVIVSDISITGDGYNNKSAEADMTCGILILSNQEKLIGDLHLENLKIFDVFHENPGLTRSKKETHSANGTQVYGWGIRIINKTENLIDNVVISNCTIQNVSHTGIKLTGTNKNIQHIKILNNSVEKTGGPGIQMSEVKFVYVANNTVSHSGNDDDSRKWGRGSGLWTWGSSNVLIEKNKFLYANGPGDSAGAHIDFNCDNVVLQYNVSAYNSGGFCEILGNNYNCAYRYNLSINDGNRTKGENNAFQEGKIFWLSGYQGDKKRKGPVNTYFYNNTIYSDGSYTPKIAIDNTTNGLLIANNIFYIKGETQLVSGDQYKPEKKSDKLADNVIFKNNLFLNKNSWPQDLVIKDSNPIFGNPDFRNPGKLDIEAYTPLNSALIFQKGIPIKLLPDDFFGLLGGFIMDVDLADNIITGNPSLGALQPE